MGLNSSIAGNIDYGGDEDFFSVQVTTSCTLTAYTTSSTDTFGYLLDSNGNQLTYNDDNPYPNFRISYSVTPGTYYVKVRHYNSSSGTGASTLSVEFSGSGGGDDHGNSMGSATAVNLNSATAGTINYGGDEDFSRVNVASSGTLTAYTTGSTDTYGYLLDASGNILAYNDDYTSLNFWFSYSVSAGTCTSEYAITIPAAAPDLTLCTSNSPSVAVPPTISDIPNQTTAQDTACGRHLFTVNDAETAAGSLTVWASSDNQALLPNGNISLGGGGANRTITLTPAWNQTGTATLTVTVSDGVAQANDTFLFTVTLSDSDYDSLPDSWEQQYSRQSEPEWQRRFRRRWADQLAGISGRDRPDEWQHPASTHRADWSVGGERKAMPMTIPGRITAPCGTARATPRDK